MRKTIAKIHFLLKNAVFSVGYFATWQMVPGSRVTSSLITPTNHSFLKVPQLLILVSQIHKSKIMLSVSKRNTLYHHHHHHWAAVVSRCWAKASACRHQVSLPCAVLCHIVSLQYLSRSSLHRLAGLPCRLFLSYMVSKRRHTRSICRL